MKSSWLLSALSIAASFFSPSNAALVQAVSTDITGAEIHALMPRSTGSVRFVNSWNDGAFRRYRFTFSGVSEGNYGQDFLNSLKSYGGITSNWQCWQNSDGTWTFDDSEAWGIAGATIIGDAIKAVTGQSCREMGYAVGHSVTQCNVISESGYVCEI